MKNFAELLGCGLLVVGVVAACSDDRGGVDECVPNATQLCHCPDGSEGVQTCTADGAWSVCECGDGGADSDVDTDADADTDTDGDLESGCNKMDILFVIDNSDSMSEEQENLIASFPAFIERIEAYDVIGTDEPLDYHVGVISTEVDHNECGDFSCSFVAGDDGVLQNAPMVGGCDPPPGLWMEGPDPDVVDQFTCVAPLGTIGWPWEMPLEAIRRGMTDGPSATDDDDGHIDDVNAGFLRDDALFVAIIITDEDDVSLGDTYTATILDPTPGDPAPVESYIEAFLNIKDSYEKMAFGLISGPPADDCETDWGDAFAAPRLHDFLLQVGDNGAWGNLCDEDLPGAIDTILDTIELACDEMPDIE